MWEMISFLIFAGYAVTPEQQSNRDIKLWIMFGMWMGPVILVFSLYGLKELVKWVIGFIRGQNVGNCMGN